MTGIGHAGLWKRRNPSGINLNPWENIQPF